MIINPLFEMFNFLMRYIPSVYWQKTTCQKFAVLMLFHKSLDINTLCHIRFILDVI